MWHTHTHTACAYCHWQAEAEAATEAGQSGQRGPQNVAANQQFT